MIFFTWVGGWLIDCPLSDWWIGRLIDWLIDWLIDSSNDWSIDYFNSTVGAAFFAPIFCILIRINQRFQTPEWRSVSLLLFPAAAGADAERSREERRGAPLRQPLSYLIPQWTGQKGRHCGALRRSPENGSSLIRTERPRLWINVVTGGPGRRSGAVKVGRLPHLPPRQRSRRPRNGHHTRSAGNWVANVHTQAHPHLRGAWMETAVVRPSSAPAERRRVRCVAPMLFFKFFSLVYCLQNIV